MFKAATSPHQQALEDQFGLADRVVDEDVLANSVERFRERGIILPTLEELSDPPKYIPAEKYGDADPQGPDPRNLWRVHWYNDKDGNQVDVPEHAVLTKELTGIDSPILVLFGNRFPMITAHKVLAAYACLAPRLVTGQFDPTAHRAIWPSTGNYARGGVAISRLMASRGVAILPAGMSQERFDWLDTWCENPAEDVIRTVGTESNVKEIYDECNRLAQDDTNFIFNQFAEFGNHLTHYKVTGAALAHVFEHYKKTSGRADAKLALMTSATGSAGTIASGEYLKDTYGTKVCAVEALECPTLLKNGYGEHNIQGIGDKHLPIIHNIKKHDLVCAVSDEATDQLEVMFNEAAGVDYLVSKGVPQEIIDTLPDFGVSSICNVLAAISCAKVLGLGEDDVLVTVATDGGQMYPSERVKITERDFCGEFTAEHAAEVWGRHLANVPTDGALEMTEFDKDRIFNLGYYTWVEQQGTPFELFESRRDQKFWDDLHAYLPVWDRMIQDFNAKVAEG
ncbi:pyridoxal-5'-phosphate-dependent protein subunit beta [Austwickia chelonae]|uniref:pyridoxal-5'-phosphate-dependent protein subunit beta n=1 Tax=Austwickia chelonae TaxID=100225 RepID=UPI000E24ECE1|nr:pyridoxal-5'-phosphate-dependent protein subunit beta [Austwickia chelonae]